MIDSGCFRHVCPLWFAPQFPMVSSFNVKAVAAATLRTESGLTTNSGRRILIQITSDVMSVRKPFLSTYALKRPGVTNTFNHDCGRIIFAERDSEFDLSRLSFLPRHHSGEWNPTSQSDGDGW